MSSIFKILILILIYNIHKDNISEKIDTLDGRINQIKSLNEKTLAAQGLHLEDLEILEGVAEHLSFADGATIIDIGGSFAGVYQVFLSFFLHFCTFSLSLEKERYLSFLILDNHHKTHHSVIK